MNALKGECVGSIARANVQLNKKMEKIIDKPSSLIYFSSLKVQYSTLPMWLSGFFFYVLIDSWLVPLFRFILKHVPFDYHISFLFLLSSSTYHDWFMYYNNYLNRFEVHYRDQKKKKKVSQLSSRIYYSGIFSRFESELNDVDCHKNKTNISMFRKVLRRFDQCQCRAIRSSSLAQLDVHKTW